MISYDSLWAIMKEKNITQYKLIYHYGLSTSLINRLKNNKPVTTSTLDKLCEILDCQVGELLTYKPNSEDFNNASLGSFVASEQSYHSKNK